MAETVSKSQFKAKALAYLRLVEQRHEELVITDHGRPVARVVPIARDAESLLAPFRGTLSRYDRPTEPLDLEDWETLR